MKRKIAYFVIGACLMAGSFLVGTEIGNSHTIDVREIEGAYVTGDELTLELGEWKYFNYYMDTRYVATETESFAKNYIDLRKLDYVELTETETNIYLSDGNWYTFR